MWVNIEKSENLNGTKTNIRLSSNKDAKDNESVEGHRMDGEGRVGINVLDVMGWETGQDI